MVTDQCYNHFLKYFKIYVKQKWSKVSFSKIKLKKKFLIFLYQHILNHTTFTKDRDIVFLILYICYSLFLKSDINVGVCVSVHITHFQLMLVLASLLSAQPDLLNMLSTQIFHLTSMAQADCSACFRIKQASDIGQKSNWLMENISLRHVFVNLLNIHLFEYSASIT